VSVTIIRKKKGDKQKSNNPNVGMQGLLFKAWKPWMAGIAIGLLVIPAYLTSALSGRNYPLGVTHGVLHVQLLVTESSLNHVWQKSPPPDITSKEKTENTADKPAGKKVSWWLIVLVISLVAGSWVSARTMNKARMIKIPYSASFIRSLRD